MTTARNLISSAHRILIATHISPDGDAIGSLLGMYWLLKAAGKNDVTPFCVDGCPDTFKFLPGSDQIVREINGEYDLVIIVDCGDASRAGAPIENLGRLIDINIDHHITNPLFARINYVKPETVATAEMIIDLIPELGFTLTPMAAECLLCGLVTDTAGFSTSSVNAKTFVIAQMLMKAGVDLPRVYNLAINRRSFTTLKLWGQALNNAMRDGDLVWATLPLSVRQAVGHNGKGDADVINVLSTVTDGNIFVTISENENNIIKVSWRARPGYDVSKVAQLFGGGGHIAASGATINGTLADIESKVLAATKEILKRDDNSPN
jgi:phosphoesterase RecJ-like protein